MVIIFLLVNICANYNNVVLLSQGNEYLTKLYFDISVGMLSLLYCSVYVARHS